MKIDYSTQNIHLSVNNHSASLKSVKNKTVENVFNLSERECEAIYWIAEGKTSWEAAKIMQITQRTVTAHINNVKKKMGAETLSHAITIGHAHNIFQNLSEPKSDNGCLTKREKECLTWICQGKTAWETSIIIGISQRTVTAHIENMKKKLNAVSQQHLVNIAHLLRIYPF